MTQDIVKRTLRHRDGVAAARAKQQEALQAQADADAQLKAPTPDERDAAIRQRAVDARKQREQDIKEYRKAISATGAEANRAEAKAAQRFKIATELAQQADNDAQRKADALDVKKALKEKRPLTLAELNAAALRDQNAAREDNLDIAKAAGRVVLDALNGQRSRHNRAARAAAAQLELEKASAAQQD